MARFLISDVERLVGVKAYILRRWEQKLPIFSPQKDYKGRRYYSERDLQTLSRMKYLVYTKGLSETAAAEQIIHDAEIITVNRGALSSLAELTAIREQLGQMYLKLKKLKGANNG